ncbi:MAG: DUF2285 domain-containing protein [Novosphingobium sp.]
MSVAPSGPGEEGSFELARVAPWLTLVVDEGGRQHAVLSDGCHQIRLDVIAGNLLEHQFIRLGFRFDGLANAAACVLPMQRLLALYRHGRFGRSLFPRDPLVARGIQLLRVHDALNDGASHRDIAHALFGLQVLDTRTDSLRSRVRRLVREARHMAKGAYRQLMVGGQ